MIYAPTLALPLQPRTTASTTCNCAGGKKSSGYSFMWGDPSIPRWCHVYFGFYGSGRTSKLIYLQRLDMYFLLYHLLREVIKWSIDEQKGKLIDIDPDVYPYIHRHLEKPRKHPVFKQSLVIWWILDLPNSPKPPGWQSHPWWCICWHWRACPNGQQVLSLQPWNVRWSLIWSRGLTLVDSYIPSTQKRWNPRLGGYYVKTWNFSRRISQELLSVLGSPQKHPQKVGFPSREPLLMHHHHHGFPWSKPHTEMTCLAYFC